MKNILITTSIPYVNAYPHIGFAMELIEADAIARWHRQMGDNVFFLTGTDEHGTKIFRRATEEGTTPQELVDKNADKYRELCKVLSASNDGFIRTTSAEHKIGAQAFWNKLMENGYLEKRKFKGLYCAGCEAFVTKKDLVDGKCPNHQKAPDELEEENWFFLLSKVSDKIAELLEKDELQVMPNYRRNEILEFVKKGLNDISFSRPKNILPWGVPVPNDDSQVMYVWCDALTNYITGLGYGSSDDSNFQKFWNNGERIHMIGKDIIRFHAAFWPAMLHVAGEKIPNKLLVHGFLTSEGQKMSKSLGNVVDPFEVAEKFGADALRFFLLKEVPFGRDADFSISRFEEIRNAYLADGLGNLLSRVHTLSTRSDINPSEVKSLEGGFLDELKKSQDKQSSAMENFELHEAISAPFEFVAFLNKKINELEPWKLVKTEPEKVVEILKSFLESLREINKMIDAYLPETSKRMRTALGLDDQFKWGNKFGEGVILFPKEKVG